MARKRGIVLGLLALAVAGVVFLAFQGGSWHTQPTPQKLASTQNWQVGYENAYTGGSYLWLDSHEIAYFQGDSMRGYQASVLDTNTQTSHPEPGLNWVQQGRIMGASPDGQWVLWDMQLYSNSKPGIAATRRSDGKTIRWPGLGFDWSECFWMPDSRHFVGISGFDTGKMIGSHHVYADDFAAYSVDHPGVQKYSLPDVRSRLTTWQNGAATTTLMPPAPPLGGTFNGRILGVTPDGHLISDEPAASVGLSPGAVPTLALSEITLSLPKSTARTFSVALPQVPQANYVDMALSPQGDRLLWTSHSYRAASRWAWLERLFHRPLGGGQEAVDVWICPLDGKAPRHLGTWSGSRLGKCRWNPDGRHLSFVKDEALYQISTD